MDDIDEKNLPECKYTFTGRKCCYPDLDPNCKGCSHLAEYRAEYESAIRLTSQRVRPLSAYERTKAQVYATGNKWAIENFHATHD